MPDRAVLEREDVALFINAASTCTGQSEFYGDAATQRVSLSFLHDYMFGNYRGLYGLCLAAGINHHNQVACVARLLAAGAPADSEARATEGALIAGALASLPPQRVYRLFSLLRRSKVNNRRTRAVIRRWLDARRDLAFDALKYRGHLRSCARHTHLDLAHDLHGFLFDGPHSADGWTMPLLETFRRAKYDQRELYKLPFTVAEGLAAARGIKRKTFLERIEPQMTAAERARVQAQAQRAGAELTQADYARLSLTRLCTLALARPVGERAALREPIDAAARRAVRGEGGVPPRVRAVLDGSFSARAGAQKRNRTLAVTLGCSRLLATAAEDYEGIWTHGVRDDLSVTARGQTDLATPLLDALDARPDLVVVVSDGFENDPVGACGEVLRLFRAHVDPEGRTAVVHINPVFDAHHFMPRPLGPQVPTVGIRDAEELPLKLAFARFAAGSAGVGELESWLRGRARSWLKEAQCA